MYRATFPAHSTWYAKTLRHTRQSMSKVRKPTFCWCVYLDIYKYLCICVYTYIHIHMYICIYAGIHMYMYAYIYMYSLCSALRLCSTRGSPCQRSRSKHFAGVYI